MTDSKANIPAAMTVVTVAGFLMGMVSANPIFSMVSSMFAEEEDSITISAPYNEMELGVMTGISYLPERMRELHASLAEADSQYQRALENVRDARAQRTTFEQGVELPYARYRLLKSAMDSILKAEVALENAVELQDRVHSDVVTIVTDAEPYVLERLMRQPDFVSARSEIDSLGIMIDGLLPDVLELRHQVIDLMCQRR
ncbi:MAG: hypothetical protein AB7W16_22465 [Candidatus Obscuribacterales bacterium]